MSAVSERAAKARQTPTPRLRTSVRGLTRLHAAQRAAYRERIVRAASEVFVERSYTGATVDDVLARAGVSRPTFYRYFDNKFDLALSLIHTLAPQSLAPYASFVAAGDRSERAVSALIGEVMEFYHAHAPLVQVMTEIAATHPQYMDEIHAAFGKVARELARLLPAFQQSPRGAKARATRARLVLNQIAITCQLTATSAGRFDRAAAIELLTGQFLAFCNPE